MAAGHWSYSVLRRLDDRGLLPRGADVARRSMPQEEIAELLRTASEADTSGTAAGYLSQFREEFRATTSQGVTFNAALLTEYHRTSGRIRTGVGFDTVWTAGKLVDNESDGDARARGQFSTRYVAGAVAVQGTKLGELQAILSGPYVGAWAGRREIGYATPHGGGLALNQHRLDAVGVFLARPLRLPVLGAIRFEMQLARIDNVLHLNDVEGPTEPFFWSARGSLEPTDRIRIGVNRGMIFGGEGNYPVTASRVLKNLIGIYTSNADNQESGFANQVLELDLRYRAPTGSVPSTWYLAWGADDAAGAYWRAPAVSAGVELGPFARADVIVGVERTSFATNDTRNSIWYQNAWMRGGWTDDGELLGHPLAGQGHEWRAFGEGGSPANGWSGAFSGYIRWRADQNLFGPERGGRSAGGTVRADVRLSRSSRAEVQGELESASGWTMSALRAGLRYLF